jgi:hypothetical protein
MPPERPDTFARLYAFRVCMIWKSKNQEAECTFWRASKSLKADLPQSLLTWQQSLEKSLKVTHPLCVNPASTMIFFTLTSTLLGAALVFPVLLTAIVVPCFTNVPPPTCMSRIRRAAVVNGTVTLHTFPISTAFAASNTSPDAPSKSSFLPSCSQSVAIPMRQKNRSCSLSLYLDLFRV